MTVTRKRAIQSGIMQCLGGLLILVGVLGSRSETSPTIAISVGTIVGIYFLATGSYRTRQALQMKADK
ncbi:MAG: hypothetical protein RIS43_245 [Actinomycetota bacterium]|jgi:uncharacterized membrane protein HdeD (DUF308 family)